MLKRTWSSTNDESDKEENDEQDLPSNFKKYTIEDRKIKLLKPKREKPTTTRQSYEGPEDAKQVDLAANGEEPRLVWIATDLFLTEEALLISTLKEYKDVFAWSYKDLKGIDPTICQHTIPMKDTAKPSRQRPYTYNDNFAKKIQEEIDKLLEAKFIYEIEHIK